MPLSSLTDKSHEPTDDAVRGVLGNAYEIWNHLIDLIEERIGPVSRAWGYTSKTTGWGLRLKQKDRIIVYMAPQTGRFLVSFALGEKAMAEAKGAKLSSALLTAIDTAPRYAEGRGVRVEVLRKSQVRDLAALAKIKCEN
jgi:hypothetical protein